MVIKSGRSFIQSGGTQTDPGVVLSQFQTGLSERGVSVKSGTSTGVSRGAATGRPKNAAEIAAEKAAEKAAVAEELEARTRKEDDFSKEEKKALLERELLRREAKRRGRGFGRLEVQKRLGGGKGISSLRTGTSRAREIERQTGRKILQPLKKGGRTVTTTKELPPRQQKVPIPTQIKNKTPKFSSIIAGGISKLTGRTKEEELRRGSILFEKAGKPSRLPEEGKPFGDVVKSGNLPAIVRSTFTQAGRGIFKVATTLTGQKPTPSQQIKGGQLVGRTLLFSTALPPTTAQIQKQFIPTKVTFVGAQQTVGQKGATITQVGFQAQKGREITKGIARGITGVRPDAKGTRFLTVTTGGRVRTGVTFPTGKIQPRLTQKFQSIQAGRTIQGKRNLFLQVGAGRVKQQGFTDFISVGIGQRGKGVIAFRGATATTRGRVDSVGLIKEINKQTNTRAFTSVRGTGSTVTSQQALGSTQQATQAGITAQRAIPKTLPFTSKPTTQQTQVKPIRVSTTTAQVQVQQPAQRVDVINIQIPTVTQATKQRSRLRLSTGQGARQQQRQVLEISQTPVQKVIQVQALAQPQKTQQRGRSQSSLVVPTLITPITKTPKPFFTFKPRQQQKLSQPKRFTVELRRFGTFRIIGRTRTQRQAFTIGRQQARTTLGATFRVKGRGVRQPTKIPQFRTKKTKRGVVFIEQPKFRLSTGTELGEIQSFRRLKGGNLI